MLNFLLRILINLLPVSTIDSLLNRSLPDSKSSFRRFSRIDPALFELFSGRKILYMFRKAYLSVPAYRHFLEKNNINPSEISSIEEFNRIIPQTTKENYIRQFPLDQRCVNGIIPKVGFLEESSGSTSMSTLWIKSAGEEAVNESLTNATIKHLFGSQCNRLVMLNCFATGGWTGGQRFASRIGPMGIIKTIGPDPIKIIRCIREIGPGFNYILGGYPPFIAEFIEFCKRVTDFSLRSYTIHILVGGEGFPEEWRDYVSANLKEGALIYSIYGAIDLDTGISVETPFTVAMRKLIRKDPEIRKALFHSDRTPCFIGQVSNQKYYVREVESSNGSKELEITVMNLCSSAPLIKYLIGDEGGVIGIRDLSNILIQKGYTPERLKTEYNIPDIIPFPVIYLFGRCDGTVSLNGALISPSEIQKVILSHAKLTSAINSFRISTETDSNGFNRLFIDVELRTGIETSVHLSGEIINLIVNGLADSNECFGNNFRRNPGLFRPEVKIFHFRSGDFISDAGYIKKQYIR